MGKQKKHFIILIVLLLAIIAFFFGLMEYNKRKEAKNLQRDTVRVFNNTEIDKFTYSFATNSYTLEKQNGKWVCLEEPSLELDNTLINGMLTVAGNVPLYDTVEDVSDFTQYGLEEPYLTVTCYAKEDKYVVEMGDFNTTIMKYFVRVNNENKVYTTDSSLYNTFTKSINSLQSKE